MSTTFRAGAQQLVDEVARLHDAGPGLPVAAIGARSRRARRRHEVAVVGVSAAAVVALVLGGAALLDRGGFVPPAEGPTEPAPAPSTPASPTPTESASEPAPEETEPTPALLGPDDVAALVVDPAAVAGVVPGLGALEEIDAGLEWGLLPEVEVEPSEECRRAITVVAEAPTHYEARMWVSSTGQVVQEFLLLDDAARAQAEFAALGEALATCSPFGGAIPESSGALYDITDLASGDGPVPSLRLAGTESGEGNTNSWLQVDSLVGNAIVRTEVIRYGAPEAAPPATAAEAAALAALVEERLGTP